MDRSAAMLILFMTLFGLLILILAMFARAPIFTSILLALLYFLYCVIFNEGKYGIHEAQENENRFWTTFSLLVTTAVCFANDSPFAVGVWSPSLGFLIVMGTGIGTNMYDRHRHRLQLSRSHAALSLQNYDERTEASDGNQSGASSTITSLTNHTDSFELISRSSRLSKKSVSSYSATTPETDHYNKLLIRINNALLIIDDVLVPSTIQRMVRRQRVLNCEKLILNIMGGVAGSGLNYILARVKLALIIYKIKDHQRCPTEHNRTSLIELLAVKRLGVLNTVSRVHLLHALQALRLSANKRGEFWVRNIFLKSRGEQLARLKTLMDSKGDYYCMNKLIYEDIRNEVVREDILKHFKSQPSLQRRKVLSDVDDTLTCSGNHWPAGIDNRYSRKTIYPGVCSFYRELDNAFDGETGNLVFLSARPHLYKDWAESHSFEKFKKMKAKGLMHCTPSLLAGDVKSGKEFIQKRTYEPLALKKYRNFADYVNIYPEYRHIFIGDNGQGDMKAGMYMMNGFPDNVDAIYIHLVQPQEQTHGYKEWFFGPTSESTVTADDDDSSVISNASTISTTTTTTISSNLPMTPTYRPRKSRQITIPECLSSNVPLHFFRTYVGAALHAYEHGFFDLSSLLQICYDTTQNFANIEKFPSGGSNSNAKSKRAAEINQDIWRVNVHLKDQNVAESLHIQSLTQVRPNFDKSENSIVRFLKFERKWSSGTLVSTSFGRGRVLDKYDPVWDLYEVELDWRPMDVQFATYQEGLSLEASKKVRVSRIDSNDANKRCLSPLHDSLKDSPPSAKSPIVEKRLPTSPHIESSDISCCSERSEKSSKLCVNNFQNSSQEKDFEHQNAMYGRLLVKASISGQNISAFDPPKRISPLRTRGRFKYFSGSKANIKQNHLAVGEKVVTPYGRATVQNTGRIIELTLEFGRLYATKESVHVWSSAKTQNNLLQSLSTLVSKHLLPSKKEDKALLTHVPGSSSSMASVLFEQYYATKANVQTKYGNGRIIEFNEVTGFYTVVLDWPCIHKPISYLLKDNIIGCVTASGCKVSGPVFIASLNLPGLLKNVDEKTGVHLVEGHGVNMSCYIQPQDLRPLAVLPGSEVKTFYGVGTVMRYSSAKDSYHIDLGWGMLYSKKGFEAKTSLRRTRSWNVFNFLSGKTSNKA